MKAYFHALICMKIFRKSLFKGRKNKPKKNIKSDQIVARSDI
jgi:hypothetical protein